MIIEHTVSELRIKIGWGVETCIGGLVMGGVQALLIVHVQLTLLHW